MKKFLFLLFLMFSIVYVNASDVDLTLSRDSYSSKETLQAQLVINIELVNQINQENFILVDKTDKPIPISLFLQKTGDKNYFIYFNLPELKSEDYFFKIFEIK